MGRLSLFKIQSLVAMIVCTSLGAWAADTATVRSTGGPNGGASYNPGAATSRSSTSTNSSNSTDANDDSNTRTSSNSSSGDASSVASIICRNNSTPDCEKKLTVGLSNLSSGGDPKNVACQNATERNNSKQSDASSKQDALFQLWNQQADMAKEKADAKIKADAKAASAKIEYDKAIAAINITVPVQQETIRNQFAQELSKLKAAMIDIGQDIMKADDDLRQAEIAVSEAANEMQATCATFAGTKANKKLDDFDKALSALKGAPNTYINYDSTNVSGATKRRDAKRARNAQLAYMSAYSACMSGATDPNGGEVGPGPSLAQKIKSAQTQLESAKTRHANNLQLIEMKKTNLKEQMDQSEVNMNTAIKTAMAEAQKAANEAASKLQQAQLEATTEVTLSQTTEYFKGSLLAKQVSLIAGQATSAGAAAQLSICNEAVACNDKGTMQMCQQQQAQQLQQSLSNTAGGARSRQ